MAKQSARRGRSRVSAAQLEAKLEQAKREQALRDHVPVEATAFDLAGPSPNPQTNLAIADIALRSTTYLARRAVEQILLGHKYAPRKARAILKGRSLPQSVIHGMIARVAIRSVPGALLVGGGLAARTLYERAKARKSAAQGRAQLDDMASEGKSD